MYVEGKRVKLYLYRQIKRLQSFEMVISKVITI
jgi:hypothetical protein